MVNWKICCLLVLCLTVGCKEKQSKELVSKAAEGESEMSSHFEDLKGLQWLAGEWEDDDKDVNISYSTEWSKNRNFLVQHFTAEMGEDADEVDGEQIIGWDPADKKVRSWVFDSDGGYGESTWSNDGSIWYSDMTYTLPEGKKASAIHVYTKLDDNSYTFSSINRNVDGELLPDIGPFKIVRK